VQRASVAVAGASIWGTFVVNVSGAFLIGLLVGLGEQRFELSPMLRTTLAVGFLSAYTTFSTLMIDSVERSEAGAHLSALTNIGGSVMLGLAVTYLGLALGRSL
jgi:CrcB protein